VQSAILAGEITVPIVATFPVEQIRDAVKLQDGRHVHGKIVTTLQGIETRNKVSAGTSAVRASARIG
jgi:hypothetical protein